MRRSSGTRSWRELRLGKVFLLSFLDLTDLLQQGVLSQIQIFCGIFSLNILTSLHLIDELEQGILSWVHPHRPHRPAQLFGADVSSSVNVKLIESLDKLSSETHWKKRETSQGYRCVENGSPVWVQQSVPHSIFVHPWPGKSIEVTWLDIQRQT